MPYLKEEDKKELGLKVYFARKSVPGELNYIFTEVIKKYIERNGESYQSYNDCIGALEACKLELYRRKVSDYEDKKIKENGDVF